VALEIYCRTHKDKLYVTERSVNTPAYRAFPLHTYVQFQVVNFIHVTSGAVNLQVAWNPLGVTNTAECFLRVIQRRFQ
jgi:hypothetical protein